MSGLTSPAASPIALPAKAGPPSVIAPGAPSLATFVDLMMGKLVPPAAQGKLSGDAGQKDAETGKILPDTDKPQIDPALAWLFGAPPTPAPQPITAVLPTPKMPPVMRGLEPGVPLIDPVPVSPALRPEKVPPSVLGPAIDIPLPFVGPVPDPIVAKAKPDIMPALSASPPVTPLPPAALPATAALPALFALAMTPDRETRDDAAPSSLPTAATLQAAAAAPVAPTGDAQRQTLDLGRQDWPQKMIDHIEALRDNANANDTSIRLKPEALGRVDVSLRTRDDGAVSVRFTAEQPTTRTLLADAAPQLTAAAEARGIRLSGTSVDLGGQGDQRPRPEAERAQNIGNHLAAPRGDDSQAVDDGRIA